jgi:hypothetical protein
LPSHGTWLVMRVCVGVAAFLVMCRMLWQLQTR